MNYVSVRAPSLEASTHPSFIKQKGAFNAPFCYLKIMLLSLFLDQNSSEQELKRMLEPAALITTLVFLYLVYLRG